MTGEETVLYLDLETFCETPLSGGQGAGTHRYAEDVEVLILAWALDSPLWGEGDITVEDLTNPDGEGVNMPSEDFCRAVRDCDRIVIHNSGFDRTISRHSHQLPDFPLDKIEDTMVRAMAHGLPGGLEKLSEIYELGEDSKHEGGRKLIMMFCKLQPKNQKIRRRTKVTNPEDWERFLSYAGGDIQSMRALRKKLPWWNYPGKPSGNRAAPEMELWRLDQRINDRGFKVDLELADAALGMIAEVKKNHDRYFEQETFGEVETANQRDKLLAHLLGWYGVTLPDLTRSTIERRLSDPDLPEPVKDLLIARLDAAMAATSKYKALKRSVSSDGRLRGTLQFSGAVRTGRWAGRIFQPQNLIRPTGAEAKQMANFIETIKAGHWELLENPNRAAAVSLRGAIVAAEGKKLVVADLSNIEGRFLAWLAGERWKLDAFAAYDMGIGPDLYKVTAGNILGKSPEDITDDERQVMGKVPELACGYQGAAGAFGTMAALYGLDLSAEEVTRIVEGWRDANPRIRQLWYDADEAARRAVLSPGITTTAGKLSFHCTGAWLLMQLPSGRKLCYSSPAIVPHPKFENSTSLSYLGVNSYTRRWERIHTYGGKLIENATQAGARDVLGHNMELIEDAGYPIILTVHDEVLTEVPDDPGFTTERLCALLATLPGWADNALPLASAGFEDYRYRKD